SVLLVLGFFTRLDAALLLVTMAVAIFFHLKADGFKIMPLETASLYAMLFLYFMASGGGALSIDALLTTWMASDE
ncbi:MAG: DoxX family membrane protein, partial [Merismopedia sp. SIO2A8]|nr:DoxX family membrane protein [Merismopedia sp. SIO2A8]